MDPFTAIGVASAVVTFIEFGSKILNRLEELSNAGDLPKLFRDIRTRLPLVLGIVTRTQEEQEKLPWAAQEALRAVVQSCFDQVEQLEGILDKLAVAEGDSTWKKGLKAAASLVEETKVQRIAASLSDNVQLLMALNVSHTDKKAPMERRMTEAPPTYTRSFGVFLLPFERDSNFVGREEVLSEVDALFSKQSRVSVAGIGGIGKSQVAIECAYRFKDSNPDAHVFWVYGGTIARFYQGYKRIAQKLDLPSWDDPDISILELVSTWFRETDQTYLLIIDNADNIEHWWPGKYKSASNLDAPSTNLSLFLPDERGSGKALITSRDTRVASRLMKSGKPLVLKQLNKEDSRRLFLAHVENDYEGEETALDTLCQNLDNLPLAITQAASFIDENNITISEYLEALEGEDFEEFLHEELNDSRRDEESVNSVFRTWKLSYDSILKQKPKAIDLLCLLCVLDRQSIPRWLIKSPEVVTSIGILTSFHMITVRSGSNSVQIHRLVQLFVQSSLRRAGKLQEWKDAAIECAVQAYPTEIGVEEWATCDALAPHVQVLLKYEYTSHEARLNLATLLCWAADFDIERGMYVQALSRAKWSLDLFKELVEPKDERLASSTWLYGRLLYYEAKSENDMEEAAEVLREALAISQPLTFNYAETSFELAHIYFAQSKEKECLEMGKASFECWKGMEGDRSSRVLDNMHDYSLELAMFGHEKEAIAQWQTILDLCPKSNASNNTKTVYKYRSLSSIAEFQGDAQLAEMLYEQLIELCSKLYNAEHVHVFDYRLSHAEQILRQNRHDEAERLSLNMLEQCKNKSEWRIMLSCYEIMAECCKMKGDLEGEERHRSTCLGLHRHYSGETHAEAIAAADAMVKCHLGNSEHVKAEPLCKQVLDWRKSSLGDSHTQTLSSLESLGVCKALQELDGEAEALFLTILGQQSETSPRVLDNLCTALWNQQKWKELEERSRQLLVTECDYEHGAHWMLVTALEKQDKMAEGLALRAESLEIEDGSHDPAEMRRKPRPPQTDFMQDRRFGRIIHPRTWSA